MDVGLYRRLLQKLSVECPAATVHDFSLFNWGEPLLHPRIHELIRLTREHGYPCVVSTNLNDATRLESVVAAAPALIKISTSGFHPATYRRTHAGGDAEGVRRNLRLLRGLLDRHEAKVPVEVAYLVYRGNVGDDFVRMQDECATLGFGFRPHWALLMPVERNVELLEGRASPADERLAAELVVHPARAQAIAARHATPGRSCRLVEDQLAINHDGSVELCCGVYTLPPVAVDFLALPLAEIQAIRRRNPYCGHCMRHHVDGVITYAGGPELDRAALAELAAHRGPVPAPGRSP
jgi:MoaA/NifB/PqqE/SkfB family radical SAM enzyme